MHNHACQKRLRDQSKSMYILRHNFICKRIKVHSWNHRSRCLWLEKKLFITSKAHCYDLNVALAKSSCFDRWDERESEKKKCKTFSINKASKVCKQFTSPSNVERLTNDFNRPCDVATATEIYKKKTIQEISFFQCIKEMLHTFMLAIILLPTHKIAFDIKRNQSKYQSYKVAMEKKVMLALHCLFDQNFAVFTYFLLHFVWLLSYENKLLDRSRHIMPSKWS